MRISDWSSDVCSSDLGALSVGIGFGLQNVVSNFVSGVILLFERPIRSGDFISVAGSEGTVRRVRIRATELETSDRETLIVPNSVLLSSPVRNRNLRRRHGRVVLPISVAYGSDLNRRRKMRSEERRVGKECVSKGYSWWS